MPLFTVLLDVGRNNICVANMTSDILFQELCCDCKLSSVGKVFPKQMKTLKLLNKLFRTQNACHTYDSCFNVRPLKILQHTFQWLQTNSAMQPWNPVSQEMSHDMLDVEEKCDCFLICCLKSINYFVKHRYYDNI